MAPPELAAAGRGAFDPGRGGRDPCPPRPLRLPAGPRGPRVPWPGGVQRGHRTADGDRAPRRRPPPGGGGPLVPADGALPSLRAASALRHPGRRARPLPAAPGDRRGADDDRRPRAGRAPPGRPHPGVAVRGAGPRRDPGGVQRRPGPPGPSAAPPPGPARPRRLRRGRVDVRRPPPRGTRLGRARRRAHPHDRSGRHRAAAGLRGRPHPDAAPRDPRAGRRGPGAGRAGVRRQPDGPGRARRLPHRAGPRGRGVPAGADGGERPLRPGSVAPGLEPGGVHAPQRPPPPVHHRVGVGHGRGGPGAAPPRAPAPAAPQHRDHHGLPGGGDPRPGARRRGTPDQDPRPLHPGAGRGRQPAGLLRPRRRPAGRRLAQQRR